MFETQQEKLDCYLAVRFAWLMMKVVVHNIIELFSLTKRLRVPLHELVGLHFMIAR